MSVRRFSLILLLLFVTGSAFAESVFAPLGIGIWQKRGTTRSLAVANSDLEFSDSTYFSFDNPATWRSFEKTRYTTSFGADKNYASDFTGNDIADNFVFPNAGIALPIYKTLGIGMLYQSLTDHDYLIFRRDEYDIEQPVDTLDTYDITRRVQGNGGLARVGGRLAFQFSKKASIGVGVDYYFGELEELVTLDFEQGAILRSGRFIRHELSGVGGSIGFNFTPGERLGFAVTARTPAYLDVRSSSTIEGGDSTGFDSDSFELPLALGLGATHEYGRVRSMASVQYEAWENSDHSFADEYTFSNSIDAALGFERLPLDEPLVPWYEVWTFRAGLRFRQHYVQAGGSDLYTYGAAFGFGIPVVGDRGMLDFAFTYDQRGIVNDNAARERIYGIQIGVSSTERWFVRRKR